MMGPARCLPKVNGAEANECVCQQSGFLPQDDRSLFIKPPTVKDTTH